MNRFRRRRQPSERLTWFELRYFSTADTFSLQVHHDDLSTFIAFASNISIYHFRGVKDARRRADHSRCITADGSELTVMLRMPKQFPTSETYTSMYASPPVSTSSKVLFTRDDSSGSLYFLFVSCSGQGAESPSAPSAVTTRAVNLIWFTSPQICGNDSIVTYRKSLRLTPVVKYFRRWQATDCAYAAPAKCNRLRRASRPEGIRSCDSHSSGSRCRSFPGRSTYARTRAAVLFSMCTLRHSEMEVHPNRRSRPLGILLQNLDPLRRCANPVCTLADRML